MMPSPPSASLYPTNGALSHSAVLSNGSHVTDGPSNPGTPPSSTNGTLTNGRDQTSATIEERKQRAKAFVATNGLLNRPTANGAVTPDRLTPPIVDNAEQTEPIQSRKRSRSGTRMAQSSRTPHNIPPRTKEMRDRILHEHYVQNDMVSTSAMIQNDRHNAVILKAMAREMRHYQEAEVKQRRKERPDLLFGYGYAGYGNGRTEGDDHMTKVIYPPHRKRLAGRKSKELRVSQRDCATQADQFDVLVPIRLDIEWDKIRLRDTFTWNIHDRVVPIELFAEQLVEDFKLSTDHCGPLVRQVTDSLREQIHEFHPHIFLEDEPLDPHLPYSAYKNDEMRIMIKLNITIGQYTLVDQFEWEINNPLNSPEEFALRMAQELALSGEFVTSIAHSIREQSQLFTRSLYAIGHPFDGRPIEDQELLSGFLPSPLPLTFRPHQAAREYAPYLFELNEAELEKTELSLSREERRQKRSTNRRGGPVLPDLKERRRTIRTLIVSSVIPGAVEDIADSRIYKKAVVSNSKTRRSGAGQRDGIDDSDDSDSENSTPGSPAIPAHLLAGTARTRGMRGAATAAQVAMRAGIGRSATPESSVALHHHETRTSGRRTLGKELREESSPEAARSLIVKLRIPRHRFQQFMRNQRAKSKEDSHTRASSTLSAIPGSLNAMVAAGTMGPPATTPRAHSRKLPDKSDGGTSKGSTEVVQAMRHGSSSQLGRIDAGGSPGPDHPIPPPPGYLTAALATLRGKYPNDSFEGTMRYTAVSVETDDPISLRQDAPPPPNTKFCYYPRIRCKDCPGKLYTPGPLMGVDNFEVHLKNRHHRDKVAKRLGDPANVE